jgi:hypothetical protein
MADKTWTRDKINSLLECNDRAVERAMIRLFELQTADEQSSANTNHQNGRGFASCDARAGTRFARWLQGMDDSNRVRYPKKSLTHPRVGRIFGRYCKDGETVIGRARRIAIKHSQQLADHANANPAPAKAQPAPVEPEMISEAEVKPPDVVRQPPAGSFAATACMMTQDDDSVFDWDTWKDEMKENDR